LGRFSGGFHPLLKCLKRLIALLPDAALRIAEDLRTRAGLSLSYDADRQSARVSASK
jgi:hypothetical protein